MANDNGRGKREDRHNINYLLNELNVSPRPPGGRVPPSLPSPHFSLGSSSSTAASSRGSKRNACPTCGHSFSQPADLRKHISTVHEKQRPFKCEVCSACFGEKGNLRKHMQSVHMNHRPFGCSLCTSKFAFKDGLARHRRLVHENIRPFRCSRCGQAYKQISQLRRHTDSCGAGADSRRTRK